MKSLAVLLTVVILVGAAGGAMGEVPSWDDIWPDTCLYVETPDPCWVAGEHNLVSPEYYIWSAYPAIAPAIYYMQTTLNGKTIDLGGDVIKVEGAYMVPAEAVKKLGLGVLYSADNMTIDITSSEHTLSTTLYAKRARVDGFSRPAKVASRWQRGRRYISLDLIAQAFNLTVIEERGKIQVSAY